ncbi:MAG: arginine--tRNA ligase [Planctomycetia bacterium]|nr:arginine--tRNA ligase [Planctomycetia bacterium]
MSILSELKDRLRGPLAKLDKQPEPLLEMVRRSQDSKFGDYQANFAMPLGKRLGRSPREIALDVVTQLDLKDSCEVVKVDGPGFINLTLKDEWLAERLSAAVTDPRLGVPSVETPRTHVVDYSAPNVAKPMHVGHIRSTVIGDALCRMLRFLGHAVTSDNHIGDWGTQFGMILHGYRNFRDDAAYQKAPVEELARLYRLVRRLMDYHDGKARLPGLREKLRQQEDALAVERAAAGDNLPLPVGERAGVRGPSSAAPKKAAKNLRRAEGDLAQTRDEIESLEASLAAVDADPQFSTLAADHADVGAAVLAETAKLHAGDEDSRRLWREFSPHCRDEIQRVYARLNVTFDHTLGESFYQDRLAATVQDLIDRGIAQESQGAVCVFLEGQPAPMLVRKQDGAFLYATTDLATIEYRLETWRPDAILYVVDHRQSMHFEHLFATVRRMGITDVELQHVSFGTVLGSDGRPFRTRSGDTVGLEGLLDEAVCRAGRIVADNDDAKPGGPELSPDERVRIAERVGIAALKYADLSQNRTSDYVFSYDKMLAMNGNTATYMQYAYARVRSIFAKGNVDVEALRASGAAILLGTPAERALGLEVLRFGEALDLALLDYRPNQLTAYLFELAGCYSTFFENCPVLKAETDALRTSRLLLCDLTARVLHKGLEILGIEVVEKM